MKKTSIGLILIIFTLTLTGCSARDVLNYVEEAFEPDYLMDTELESATWKNSSEPGAITGRAALDAVRNTYASSLTSKRYFDETLRAEDKGYVYFNKNQEMYLALTGIVNLEGEDYYEIILFKYLNPDDIYDYSKDILESYYVNIKTLEIFSSGNKPVETYKLEDATYGFSLNLPKEFEENYITLYSEPSQITFGDKETNVRTVTISYREGNVSDDLFDIVIFEGNFKASDFKTDSDAYFLGSNNKYSICLVKAELTDNYLQNPRKILTEYFDVITRDVKVFDVELKEDKETKEEKKN